MRRFQPVFAGVILLSGALAPSPVRAQQAQPVQASQATLDGARAAFQRGVAHLNAGRYADALLALDESYRLNPVPVVLMNMGIAHQGLHHDAEAVEHLERYLRDAGAQVPPDRAREVRATITQLRRNLATIQLSIRPDTFVVTVDGQPRTPLASEVPVNPGHRVVTVTAPRHQPLRREFDLGAGNHVIVDATLVPEVVPAPPPIEPPAPVTTADAGAPVPVPGVVLPVHARPERRDAVVSSPIYTRWWFWTLIGVGVVGATTGLVIGLSTQGPVENVAFTTDVIRFP